MLLYLLLVKSDVGCDYIPSYTQMKSWQFLALVVWRPLSGYITDMTSGYADWVLLATCTLEFVTLVGMVWLALTQQGFSSWILLGTQLFKNLVETQMYNSIWKIFKMRLEFRFDVGCGMQCGILTRVGLLGEGLELVYDGLTCALGYYLMDHVHVEFNTVLLVFFGSSVLSSLVCMVVAVMMVYDPEYFTAPIEPDVEDAGGDAAAWAETYGDASLAKQPLLTESAGNGAPSAATSGGGRPAAPRSWDSATGSGRLPSAAHLHASRSKSAGVTGFAGVAGIGPAQRQRMVSMARAKSTSWDPSGEGRAFKGTGAWEYIKLSTSAIYRNAVARRTITHSLLVYIPYAVLSNAEALSLPQQHMMPVKKTEANYCGHLIQNVAKQDIIVNVSYFFAVATYYYVLRRTTPRRFYAHVYPVCGVLMMAGSVLLLQNFGLPAMPAYVINSLCVAMLWFFFMYSGFLATAAIPQRFYGAYSVLSGYIQTLCSLGIYAVMTWGAGNTELLVFTYLALAVSIVYAMFFGCMRYKSLVVAGKGYCD